MNATRVQRQLPGDVDYTPAAAVSAGALAEIGEILGLADHGIAASAVGGISTNGAYRVIKDGTTGPVFEVGDSVFWNKTTSLAVRTGGAGCRYVGTCVTAAGTDQAWVDVLFDPNNLPGYLADMLWEDVDVSGGDKTLDIQDCGKVMNVTVGHAANGVILPPCVAGLEFVIRCGTAGQRVFINMDATGTADKVAGPDIAGTEDKGRILAAATSRKGDYVHLKYGGADTWMIVAQRGIWVEES